MGSAADNPAGRVEKILRAHVRSLDPQLGDDTPPELALDEPGLAACYAAAAQGLSVSGDRAGQPPLRLIASPEPPARPRAIDVTDQPIAEVRGINIHAAQVVDGRDRRRVERLCKYIARPPVAAAIPFAPLLRRALEPLLAPAFRRASVAGRFDGEQARARVRRSARAARRHGRRAGAA
ncbi:MAG: hypothetical protein IPM35_30045 [Myxococcales bacterium]|nr:hypothetical protein [Myxococcales bacterium]